MAENQNNEIVPAKGHELVVRSAYLAGRGLNELQQIEEETRLLAEASHSTAIQIIAEKELSLDLGGGVKLELVLIPAGKFMMGSPDDEQDHDEDEAPQHEVTISKPFYMGKYEVTVAQFRKFVEATDYITEAEKSGGAYVDLEQKADANWRNPYFKQSEKHPVVYVSWNDAQEFVKWATALARRRVRLPTEAEWEYACRAGTTTRFHTGDAKSNLADAGWYCINSDLTARPVGQKTPNAFGLYDMHGNVREWCQDWFGEYEVGAVVDPQGPSQGDCRVLRGGCWYSLSALDCRSANRGNYPPDYQYRGIGFRVVVAGP